MSLRPCSALELTESCLICFIIKFWWPNSFCKICLKSSWSILLPNIFCIQLLYNDWVILKLSQKVELCFFSPSSYRNELAFNIQLWKCPLSFVQIYMSCIIFCYYHIKREYWYMSKYLVYSLSNNLFFSQLNSYYAFGTQRKYNIFFILSNKFLSNRFLTTNIYKYQKIFFKKKFDK